MKSWYTIKAQAADGVAEMSVHSEIGAWGVNAQQFIRDLKSISAGTINLSINSPGGSVFDALAIFNALRSCGKVVNVKVLGIAASAASYLALAGDHISMPENTFMFIHNPINGVYGNADDMREMADVLDKLGASLTATYAKRWTGTADELDAALADESYLTAAECLDLGLCDEVTPSIEAKALFDLENLPLNIQALFKPSEPAPVALLDDETLADQVKAHCDTAGLSEFAASIAADPTVVNEAMAVSAIRAAREVKALCDVAGKPDMASAFIKTRASLADARAQLTTVLAEEDAATAINTAAASANLVSPANASAEFDPTALWKQIKDMQRSNTK